MSEPKLDRFSDRWEKETPLECFCCGEQLTEAAELHYWESNPDGQKEPRCLDCDSQIQVQDEPEPRLEGHLLSNTFLGCAIGCMVRAAFDRENSGKWILAAIGLGNLGLLVRICGH